LIVYGFYDSVWHVSHLPSGMQPDLLQKGAGAALGESLQDLGKKVPDYETVQLGEHAEIQPVSALAEKLAGHVPKADLGSVRSVLVEVAEMMAEMVAEMVVVERWAAEEHVYEAG